MEKNLQAQISNTRSMRTHTLANVCAHTHILPLCCVFLCQLCNRQNNTCAYNILSFLHKRGGDHNHSLTLLNVYFLHLSSWLESCKIRADVCVGNPPQTCCCDRSRDGDFWWVHHARCCTRKRKSSGLFPGLRMIILGQRQKRRCGVLTETSGGLSRLSSSSMTRVNCKRAASRAWPWSPIL